MRTTLALNLCVGVCGALLLSAILPSLVVRLFHLPIDQLGRVAAVLRWIALGFVMNQAAAVFLAVPPAFQRYRLVALGHSIGQTSLAVGGVLGAWWWGLEGYAAGTATGAAIGALTWRAIARSLLPGISFRPGFDKVAWRQCFHFGGWQAVAQLGGLLAGQAERLLLGIFIAPAAVGFYNIAQGFEQKIYAAVYKMSEVLFPHFSTLERSQAERQAALLLRASWILTSLAVCALVPLIPLSGPLLATWISPETGQAAGPVMQALAIAGILGCATNASFFFLLGVGDTRGLASLAGVTGLVTVVSALVVLPHWGLPAAGLSAAVAMVAQQVYLATVLLPRLPRSRLQALHTLQSPNPSRARTQGRVA